MRALIVFAALMASGGAVAQDWSGPYVGVTASPGGGGLIVRDFPLTMGGVQASLFSGMLAQRGDLIFGIEADLGLLNSTRFYEQTYFGIYASGLFTVGPSASLRGRLGVPAGRFLPYVTGGVTMAQTSVALNSFPAPFEQAALGVTFGGGIEYMMTDAIRVRAEYLRTDLGTVPYYIPTGDMYPVSYTLDAARLGLSVGF